jgi:hypothetical protein
VTPNVHEITWAGSDEPLSALVDILHDVRRYVRRYVVLSDDQAIAVALWVGHTHVLAASDTTPYLSITSATKRAAKHDYWKCSNTSWLGPGSRDAPARPP